MSAGEEALEARLARTWARPTGVLGWLRSVDHKSIALRYTVTALVFFALAGVLALAMRLQLARPDNTLLDADRYNQFFTVHGTTMMFLFAVPVMEAMALYLVPLAVGARAIAFPRLTAFSYWIYLAGGVMIYVALLIDVGPETGWFSYVPLATLEFSPSKRTDIWAQMVTFSEVAALSAAVSLITTILKLRAPGMTLARIPLFAWAMLVTSFMVVFAMPAIMLATSFLIADRLVGTRFFAVAEGGEPLIWQHLFWFFGHPEVYIIFLPGLGMVSEIVRTFSRRTIFGYPLMVLALIATGFLSFGLWVHHMFATGLPRLGNSFYTAASMAIAVPTGLQIFCWIAMLWDGRRIRLDTPMLYVIGFIVTLVLGGLTGVMLASVPLDQQVHDTFFVVAHFHYVLIGGAVFPLLGAIHYWFPKITGRMMSEALGKAGFWLVFSGFHTTFFPMHILGLSGMPRRVYTYPESTGWGDLNLLSTVGAFAIASGVAVFVVNAARSWLAGSPAPANPWDAPGLEWSPASPPPPYNFAYAPVVESRDPLWTARETLPVLTGLSAKTREVLVTSVGEARPEARESSPSPSIWPFLTALATTAMFIGSIFDPRAVIWGGVLVGAALTGWFWPAPSHVEEIERELDALGAPEDVIEAATR